MGVVSRTSSIAVVIPVYRARLLAAALESVFIQSRVPDEVIVVNDGSPDEADLYRALAAHGARVRLITQANQGAGAARNHGIRIQTGYDGRLSINGTEIPEDQMQGAILPGTDPTLKNEIVVLVGEELVDRQRDGGPAVRLADREVACLVPQILRRLHQVDRQRIVDLGVHTLALEERHQIVAALHQRHVDGVAVTNCPPARRDPQGRCEIGEGGVITGGVPDAAVDGR